MPTTYTICTAKPGVISKRKPPSTQRIETLWECFIEGTTFYKTQAFGQVFHFIHSAGDATNANLACIIRLVAKGFGKVTIKQKLRWAYNPPADEWNGIIDLESITLKRLT